MAFIAYNLLLLVLSPIIAFFILYRILVSRKSRRSWRQQLGWVDISPQIENKEKIWIHAVSVGEAVASTEVVSELKRLIPHVAVIVSTTTETGQEMARKSVKDADDFLYYPFDLLPCVIRSILRVRPVVFASTDTEIWPNFRHVARLCGVKSAIINGTVSDKTMSGARWVPWIYRWTLGNIDVFCMQSEADAQRIIKLGADSSKVVVTGNCKADQIVKPMNQQEIDAVRAWFKLLDGDRVFVAGSTNPGEDEPIIDAFLYARRLHPNLRLIIAPRQIERRDEIRRIASERGLTCGLRSEPDSVTGSEDVLILDTFGELARVYAIADVTFVGGSLIPRGCHSILQPISQGKPVFFGPYTFKAKDLVAQAKAAGVGFEVKNGEELGRELAKMLNDSALLAEIASRCEQMMAANIGASKRTAEVLARLYYDSKHTKLESI